MTDLRKYAQDTNKRLVIGLLLLVFTLGLSLIYFFAALLGLFSLLGVLFLILLIWLILRLMERLAK